MYANAYRGFRTEFGQHKVASENTLKGIKKILIYVHVLSHEFFQLNFSQMHFFYRIIDNFIQYGTLQDRRYDAPGPSYTVVTEETVDEVEKYFSENPNFTIRQAAQVLKISKSSLHRIVKNFLKFHRYKILTTKSIEVRVKFCKTITEMFESGEIDDNKIDLSDKAHFWLNGYVNEQN